MYINKQTNVKHLMLKKLNFDLRDWPLDIKVRLVCYYDRWHENFKIGHLICDPPDNTSDAKSLMMTNSSTSSEWHFVMTFRLTLNGRNE